MDLDAESTPTPPQPASAPGPGGGGATSILELHNERIFAFNSRFMQVANLAIGVALLAALVILLTLVDYHPGEVITVSVGLVVATSGAVLARRRQTYRYALLGYLTLPVAAAIFACFSRDYMVDAFLYSALLYLPTAFVARPTTPLGLYALQLGVLPFLIYTQISLGLNPRAEVLIQAVVIYTVKAAMALVLWFLAREMVQNQQMLRNRIEEIEVVGRHAGRISEGDLSVEITERGFWAESFRSMIGKLQGIIRSIAGTSVQINAASEQIFAACGHQQKGATEQSSAVAEIRQTMEELVKSSKEISKASRQVAQNADTTLQNNTTIEKRIHVLSEKTNKIKEILEIIQEIANKSDLLALNASLEGVRAGEAGRGFTLVAAQMQRLAENVMASVKDIKALTGDIIGATNASVLVTEEGTKMATYTAQSAQQINLITQQQQSATEQVWRAVEDILTISEQTAAGSTQTLTATQDLMRLSRELKALVATFKMREEEAKALAE